MCWNVKKEKRKEKYCPTIINQPCDFSTVITVSAKKLANRLTKTQHGPVTSIKLQTSNSDHCFYRK